MLLADQTEGHIAVAYPFDSPIVDKPCLLRIWWELDETGEGWLVVYRSIRLRERHQWLDPVRGYINAGPVLREMVPDNNMMGLQAELSTYDPRKLLTN